MTNRRSTFMLVFAFAFALASASFAAPALAQTALDNPAALREQAPATYKVRFDTSKAPSWSK